MKKSISLRMTMYILVTVCTVAFSWNAAGQSYGTCNADNNKPNPIPCGTTTLVWDDTFHCQSDFSDTQCYPETGTVTHNNDTITWTGQNVYVGGTMEYTEEGNQWEWDDPPAGCVTYVCIATWPPYNGNYQIWTVYTPSESDTTSNVQGATCTTLTLPGD